MEESWGTLEESHRRGENPRLLGLELEQLKRWGQYLREWLGISPWTQLGKRMLRGTRERPPRQRSDGASMQPACEFSIFKSHPGLRPPPLRHTIPRYPQSFMLLVTITPLLLYRIKGSSLDFPTDTPLATGCLLSRPARASPCSHKGSHSRADT